MKIPDSVEFRMTYEEATILLNLLVQRANHLESNADIYGVESVARLIELLKAMHERLRVEYFSDRTKLEAYR